MSKKQCPKVISKKIAKYKLAELKNTTEFSKLIVTINVEKKNYRKLPT